jgi:hypothetical protein
MRAMGVVLVNFGKAISQITSHSSRASQNTFKGSELKSSFALEAPIKDAYIDSRIKNDIITKPSSIITLLNFAILNAPVFLEECQRRNFLPVYLFWLLCG